MSDETWFTIGSEVRPDAESMTAVDGDLPGSVFAKGDGYVVMEEASEYWLYYQTSAAGGGERAILITPDDAIALREGADTLSNVLNRHAAW